MLAYHFLRFRELLLIFAILLVCRIETHAQSITAAIAAADKATNAAAAATAASMNATAAAAAANAAAAKTTSSAATHATAMATAATLAAGMATAAATAATDAAAAVRAAASPIPKTANAIAALTAATNAAISAANIATATANAAAAAAINATMAASMVGVTTTSTAGATTTSTASTTTSTTGATTTSTTGTTTTPTNGSTTTPATGTKPASKPGAKSTSTTGATADSTTDDTTDEQTSLVVNTSDFQVGFGAGVSWLPQDSYQYSLSVPDYFLVKQRDNRIWPVISAIVCYRPTYYYIPREDANKPYADQRAHLNPGHISYMLAINLNDAFKTSVEFNQRISLGLGMGYRVGSGNNFHVALFVEGSIRRFLRDNYEPFIGKTLPTYPVAGATTPAIVTSLNVADDTYFTYKPIFGIGFKFIYLINGGKPKVSETKEDPAKTKPAN